MTVKRPKLAERHRQPFGTGHTKPRGLIVHTTESTPREGPSDRNGVIDYLASRGLSVPVVFDDDGGTEMVPRPYTGIHAACIRDVHGIEQIGFARWTRAEWMRHKNLLDRTAKEIAWFLAEVLEVAVTLRNLKRVVVGHDRDHVFGGCSTHWDPGPGYPWDYVFAEAIKHAKVVGYRVVATKGENRRVRKFRANAIDRALAYAKKKARRGWRVVLRKKRFHADLDE